MGKKRNVKVTKKDEEMEVADTEEIPLEDEEVMDEGTSEDDDEDVSDEEEELLTDNLANVETENFDFEAFPLNSSDILGLVNLLTQIFLRNDVDCEGLAKAMVEMSPVGSVFRPAEEALDDDDDAVTYGVMSIAELVGPNKYQTDLSNLILNRARKFASKEVVQAFEGIFNSTKDKKKNYLLVNERMLHFPHQIAAPAFASLKSDFEEFKLTDKIDNVVIISKIRIPDTALEATESNSNSGQKKKKMGKAEKKRQKAAALANAEVEFENQEEELMFNNAGLITPTYFQYNVEGDVEKESKFHTTYINGVPHRPYRRVTILNKNDFYKFMDLVGQMG